MYMYLYMYTYIMYIYRYMCIYIYIYIYILGGVYITRIYITRILDGISVGCPASGVGMWLAPG